MEKAKYPYETLYRAVKFLAQKEGHSLEGFIGVINKKMESEALMQNLLENFQKLPSDKRAQMMRILEEQEARGAANAEGERSGALSGEYALEELIKMDVGELVKTKPRELRINGRTIKTKSWTDVSCEFVRFLVDAKDLRLEDLPVCPSDRSPKAFINSHAGHPKGVDAYSNFVEVEKGFFVDTKYNSKYHLLNIWRTLKKLYIESKYDIHITL